MIGDGLDRSKPLFRIDNVEGFLSFRSSSSVSIDLVRYSDSLLPRRSLGWIDVHYPCDEHIKVQIRISGPREYHSVFYHELFRDALFGVLDISRDETYEMSFFEITETVVFSQSRDREGRSDRI